MTAASRPQVVELRSGDVVQVRQVRPGDAPALARAYAASVKLPASASATK